MHEPLDRRSFLAATGASLAGAAFAQDAKPELPHLTHGPFRADTGVRSFDLWARVLQPGEYVLTLQEPRRNNAAKSRSATAHATADNDLTLRWTIEGLDVDARDESGDAEYFVRINFNGQVVCSERDWLPNPPVPERTSGSIAFGSCADERKFSEQPVWRHMRERKPNLVVLLGDTPYIDSTDLGVRRERYRAFYSQPQFAELARKAPIVATWDDHDYATNDRFGDFEGRDDARRAFLEYHGPGEWGENSQGIYTRRRVGPIEVFLLDTRWFADTEPSPLDASKKTLLGAAQWKWLQRGLEASDAPFKVLASGMIWNEAVRPLKRDHWGHWPHERDGIFRWLGEKNISGVVLVGGDIHRTRVVQHATKSVVGYDIVELITSPLANSVIDAANAPHPGLLFDAGVEQSCLWLSAAAAATSKLDAVFMDGSGNKLFGLERLAVTLSRRD